MKSIIASSISAALQVSLPCPGHEEAFSDAAAHNAAAGLLAHPLDVLEALVAYLDADIHVFRYGGRLAINIKLTDDQAVADVAALLGGPAPQLRWSNGHEWMESCMLSANRSVDISSKHRARCECKEGA